MQSDANSTTPVIRGMNTYLPGKAQTRTEYTRETTPPYLPLLEHTYQIYKYTILQLQIYNHIHTKKKYKLTNRIH
jgi:hypothetical protein